MTADEAHIQASYGHGILEIEISLTGGGEAQRHVPMLINKHIDPT